MGNELKPDLRKAAERAVTVLRQVATDIEATAQLIEWHHSVCDVLDALQSALSPSASAPVGEPVAESNRELIGAIEQEFVALPDLPAWIRRLQDRVRSAPPDWKGYALLGTGQYAINHTPGPMDPELGAELIISIATEADRANNRQVGEERDTDPNAGPIMPEQMAVRIGFLTPAALDALESQLRHLRRENFPESASPLPQEPKEAEQVCAEAYQVVGSLLSDLGKFDTPEAEKILDNLSQAKLVHKDVLPWPSYASGAQEGKAGEWLPIESAPRDGSHIHLYRPEIQFVGYYAVNAGRWCINAPGLPVMEPAPTHWRPIPAPPSTTESADSRDPQ
jgi:hypothetical protein